MDNQSWSGVGWSERGGGMDTRIQAIHQKLVDLKAEMQKLSDDSGGQLLFVSFYIYVYGEKGGEDWTAF